MNWEAHHIPVSPNPQLNCPRLWLVATRLVCGADIMASGFHIYMLTLLTPWLSDENFEVENGQKLSTDRYDMIDVAQVSY